MVRHERLRVTSVSRTLVDLAGTVSFGDLRRALAEADHRRLLDPAEVGAILGRGHQGAGALREALRLRASSSGGSWSSATAPRSRYRR